MSWSSQCPEDELTRNINRSLRISGDELNRSQEDKVNPAFIVQPPVGVDFELKRNPNRRRVSCPTWTPRNDKELILYAKQMKNGEDVEPTREDGDDDVDVDDNRFVYIEEALKGEQMNETWKRKIFSQRVEDDDDELRGQIDSRLKHYVPEIAQDYWSKERYSILEQREYHKDVCTTEGFDVGYYPYLMRTGSNIIVRYYCPPDANLPQDGIDHLHGLADRAIQFYNSKEETNYSNVSVMKTMADGAAGNWFYMTFQASDPYYGDRTFEAKLFESIPRPERHIEVDFVRLKMGAGPSSQA